MDFYEHIYDDMKAAFYAGVVITEHGMEWATPQGRGYGEVNWNSNGISMRLRAHRVAWILENGPIPEGYIIDHDPSCPKSCVTVAHFLCVTQSEHIKLGWERGEMSNGTVKSVIERGETYEWQEEKSCPECRTIFMMTNQRQIYCSYECQQIFKERRRNKRRYPRPDSKTCEWCSEEFTPKRVDSRFCSRTCIDADQNLKKKRRKEGT